ncbi:hypothetical protein PVAP13_4NG038950 [Panicum virgatum]|uniref:Uncharacterized protein n=1 Tax=Panicum virgatum TaxID=38727 RepID=A0A8T0T7C5_PANVG|nr:hypothetical protein PVAP13_4NG038950 [Panicum virgatum]
MPATFFSPLPDPSSASSATSSPASRAASSPPPGDNLLRSTMAPPLPSSFLLSRRIRGRGGRWPRGGGLKAPPASRAASEALLYLGRCRAEAAPEEAVRRGPCSVLASRARAWLPSWRRRCRGSRSVAASTGVLRLRREAESAASPGRVVLPDLSPPAGLPWRRRQDSTVATQDL